MLISVNIEFTKVTLFRNAMWHVNRSVITATSAIESLVSETPRSGTKFHLNTPLRKVGMKTRRNRQSQGCSCLIQSDNCS